jgi:Ca2+-binding RTX toxin-like protein
LARRRFRTLTLLLTVSILLVVPGVAGAATLSLDNSFDDEIDYVGDPAESSNLVVTAFGSTNDDASDQDSATFTDLGGDLIQVDVDDQDRCTGDGTSTVVCEGEDLFSIELYLGDETDVSESRGNFQIDPDGEEGNDILTGSDRTLTGGDRETVDGGDGDDLIALRGGDDNGEGGSGTDTIDGGAGNDVFEDAAGEGNDTYTGGDGLDEVGYSDVNGPPDAFAVDLAAGRGGRTNYTPESDVLTSVEDAFTGSGADTLSGTAGSNVVGTGDGNDAINALGGADSVFAGDGDDTIEARDGANDRIDCGDGVDTVQADQFDELTDCENAPVTVVRAANADLAAPVCTVRKVKRTYSRRAFFRGFRPDVDCNEAATVDMQVVANVKRGSFVARVGDLVLASRRTTAGTNVRLKPGKRFTRQLAKGRRIRARLIVEARDQFGNRSVKTKAIKVKKAPRKRRRARG